MPAETANPTAGALLGLFAQTALHAGAGTPAGAIDAPILRNRSTGWPAVAAGTLKAVLRDAVQRRGGDVAGLFGAPSPGGELAGALSVTDARLVAFPVRSLRGVHAWVSCPAALDRLARDADLAGVVGPAVLDVRDDECLVAPGCACVAAEGRLVLEEYPFEAVGETAGPVAEWLLSHLLPTRPAYESLRARFARHLVLLSDGDFTHFTRHATEVASRLGHNSTAFTEEYLPAEAILYAVVLANPTRGAGSRKDAAGLLGDVEAHLAGLPYLQVGGDETTGKGYCAWKMTRG